MIPTVSARGRTTSAPWQLCAAGSCWRRRFMPRSSCASQVGYGPATRKSQWRFRMSPLPDTFAVIGCGRRCSGLRGQDRAADR